MKAMFVLIFALMASRTAEAQFIQFSMVLDSELAVNVTSELSFGALEPTDSVSVGIGDYRMGVIQVDGVTNQTVIVRITSPQYLLHEDFPECDSDECRIDVNLTYVINKQNVFEPGLVQGLLPISQLDGLQITLDGNQTGLSGTTPISSIYIGVYGQAITRFVIPGNYSGSLTLWLEY
jgi:hypothetical protein